MNENEAVMNGFVSAAQDVLQLMLDIEASPAKPESATFESGREEVSVSIGLTGDLSGEASFHFPRETALEIVKIMSGMEIDQVDDFVTSALGEISNIISGNAATCLSQQQINCDILPPRITTGDTGEAPGASNAVIQTHAGNMEVALELGTN